MRKTFLIHCQPVCVASLSSIHEHCSLQFRSWQHPVYKSTRKFPTVWYRTQGLGCVRLSDYSLATVRKKVNSI
jgi:hypothetical protein